MAEVSRSIDSADRRLPFEEMANFFMGDVNSLEESGRFNDLNLLGGDQTTETRAKFEENKAKRQMATEALTDIMKRLYLADGSKDVIKQAAFVADCRIYLIREGLKVLNELYHYARGGDRLSVVGGLKNLYGHLRRELDARFQGKVYEGTPVLPEADNTQTAVRKQVAKATKGLELDAKTRAQLGPAQVDTTGFGFAHKVGTKTVRPVYPGRKGKEEQGRRAA